MCIHSGPGTFWSIVLAGPIVLCWAQEATSLPFPGNLLLSLAPSRVLTALSPTLSTHLTLEACWVASGRIHPPHSGKFRGNLSAGLLLPSTRKGPCYYGNTGATFHPKQGPSPLAPPLKLLHTCSRRA